jgi:CDP-diacylglycerol--glycerol-3-phosphate 3-phosphatidyltransferase
MGIYAIKPKFQQFLKPVEDLFVKLNVHPTTINISALLLSIIAGLSIYYSSEHFYLWILIPIIAFVRTALNALDGLIARRLKIKNQEYGEVLNEFMDRISDVAIFFGLGLASFTSLWLGSLTVIMILLNSYLSIVSKAAGASRQYGGVMGKADRMGYLGIAAIAILLTNNLVIAEYLLWFILLGTAITLVQRFQKTRHELL